MTKQTADKNFRCNICQRGFTRIDHLKRHHLRHSGVKPYSCIFCSEAFARCDNLRDHYPDCVQRGENPIPETGQRGRRRHACESCTSMKLRCDGQSPCSSCVKRNLKCNNTGRPKNPNIELPPSTESSLLKNEELESSDRGSINFLLNGGTDSFTERFRLPPRSDRARGMQYHTQKELEEATSPANTYALDTTPPNINTGFFSEFDDLSTFEESFMSFMTGPFAESQKSMVDPYSGTFAAHALLQFPNQEPQLGMASDSSFYEPESAFSSALVQAILAKTWTVNMDAKSQQEISSNLHFLLTTRRIQKFVSLYFLYWHNNCQLLHPPSFNMEQVTMPLLAAVVFMGAMYSNEEREAYVARRMLDFAELYVFSTDVFSYEHEVSCTFIGRPATDAERKDWVHFQNLQAGYLMVVTQYWAGSKVSRNRAMEARFNEVVAAARRMELTRCKHLPEDRIHETLWIQKECRIRTINVISLLDCAFSFYSNFPCRLTPPELECDLPCEESVFNCEHPFAQLKFRFTRETTVYDAFQHLFQDEQGASACHHDQHHTNHCAHSPSIGTTLTVTDMFLMIHMLYSYINSHMTVLAPIMRMRQLKKRKEQSTANSENHKGSLTFTCRSITSDDPVLISIRAALSRWRTLWLDLKSRIPADEWAAMGFMKTAYNFWQVAQLLITKKHSVDVIMQMEVKCEDKLEKLKVLLQDDND
ncbi:C2H2 finger domain protein (Zms1), putative [Talaromyces stipitatus ATCC 10500]|uniref:C2H2 finger domain protein (Zms1), putative n=1 Tax=Talaromyces stipitatus (strain ATCC 10500 / CBS 375.48 / QM 6759 / NRRL 1006) TaxID=441959 RepID=B8ML05_TALSN|nr:C2H2 finger domain protein (Zms1), putative [Talaromyces stipitatus ATCC 10500]EED15421.1 C2H2 finger domain protein (Zms1), putative [Talaromyces stipitatus ATCC 10500]